MATSIDTDTGILQNYILKLKSGDMIKRLESLRRTRNFIRDKGASSRIEQFREIGGLEILVKLLREVVNDRSKLCAKASAKVNIRIVSKSSQSQSQSRQLNHSKSLPEDQRLEYLNMCISILATCCTEPGCKQKVKESGCVLILGKILKNEKDEGVINRTARAVANLAKVADLSTSFHRQEFIPCLTELLTKSGDTYMQYSLVRSLRFLADTPDHRLTIINNGAIKAILGTLKSTQDNLVAMAIETATEMTQPHLFNHLKKPSWRALWETIGEQTTEAVAPILELLDTAKKSVADQALALLNNLMNSHAVRLAVGSCDKIPDFVKICGEIGHANFLPYLQCLALCCKESVNRAKVKRSDGLDVLLRILQSEKVGLQGRHVAVAGLVHFYHDDPALRYLCLNNLTGGLAKYLSDYIERDAGFPFSTVSKPVYKNDSKVSSETDFVGTDGMGDKQDKDSRCIPLDISENEKDHFSEHHHSKTHSDPEETAGLSTKVVTSDSAEEAASLSTNISDIPTSYPARSTAMEAKILKTPVKEDIPAKCNFVSKLPPYNPVSPEEFDTSVSVASSDVPEEDADVSAEYSRYLDQSPTPYSPPRVDWSQVFACREQQGYRGLSPQSNLSSQSDSLEREPPKYQYFPEWTMSPMSDGSWTMAEEAEGLDEEVQYSPVVSETDDQDELVEQDEPLPQDVSGQLMEKPSTGGCTPLEFNPHVPAQHSMSSSQEPDPKEQLTGSPKPSPVKRARSPSIDSSYESEILEETPQDDGSCKPEGYALHLLSKCSYMEETQPAVATFEVVEVLLKLALHSAQFKGRSTKILNRLLSCRLAFEPLVKEGVPQFIASTWERFYSKGDLEDTGNGLKGEPTVLMPRNSLSKSMKNLEKESSKYQERREKRFCLRGNKITSEETELCDVSDEMSDGLSEGAKMLKGRLNHQLDSESCPFMEKLTDIADSSFGRGVISHLANSPEVSEKMAAIDALSVLCRSHASLCYHVIEKDAVSIAVDILRSNPSDGNVAILIRFLRRLYSAATSKKHSTRESQKKPIVTGSRSAFQEDGTSSNTDCNSTGNVDISSCCYRSSNQPMDLEISVNDGHSLRANRDILCQRSEYFSRMLKGSYREASEPKIRIRDVTRMVMDVIIHHLYGCQWGVCTILDGINIHTGLELSSTAGKLLLPHLQEAVAKCCLQHHVTADTASAVCIHAVDHGCATLSRYCLKYMLGNKGVGCEQFIEMLNSPNVDSISSEIRSIVEEEVRKL